MDEIQAKSLRQPFPASAIGKLPKGGVMLDYVGHAATTDRLLQVDPGWSWEPFALDESGLPAMDKAGNLWIRLTVCGVTRPGCGDGNSMKERIGDAIRNAAMRFGVALDLWAKEDLAEMHNPGVIVVEPEQPAKRRMSRGAAAGDKPVTADQLTKIGACFTDIGIKDRAVRLQYVADVIGRTVETSKELTVAEGSRLIEALEVDLHPPDAFPDEERP